MNYTRNLLRTAALLALVFAAVPADANDAIIDVGVPIAGAPSGIADIALSDVDHDGDVDLITCGSAGLHWLDNGRDGTWTTRVIEVDGAPVGACATVAPLVGPLPGGGRALATSAGAFLQQPDGTWRTVSPDVPFTASALGDADGDGELELLYCGANSVAEPGNPAFFVAEWAGDAAGGAFTDTTELIRDSAACVRTAIVDLYRGEAPRAVSILRNDDEGWDANLYSFVVTRPGRDNHSELASQEDFVAGDVDLDGDLDVVAFGLDWPRVYESDGTRARRSPAPIAEAVRTWIAVSDLDADERPELVGARSGGDITQFTFDGAAWTPRVLRTDAPADVVGVRATDVDRDGDDDLLVAHAGGVTFYPNVRVRAASLWTFDGAAALAGWVSGRVVPVDFDGDGDDDLVVSNDGVGPIDLLENTGDGLWPSRRLDGGRNISGEGVAADFDGDDDLDVAISGGTQVYWWRNNGDAAWTATNLRSIAPAVLDAGDVDADGDVDLVAAETGTGLVYLFTNDGTGGFSGAAVSEFDLLGAAHIRLIDLDRDGDLDIALGASGFVSPNGGVAWLENTDAGDWPLHTVWSAGRMGLTDLAFGDFDADGAIEAFALVRGGATRYFTRVDAPENPRDPWTATEFGGRSDIDGLRLEPRLNNSGFPEVVGWGAFGPVSARFDADGSVRLSNAAPSTASTSDVAAVRMQDGSFALAIGQNDVDQIQVLPRRSVTENVVWRGIGGAAPRSPLGTPLVVAPFVDVAVYGRGRDTQARLEALALVPTVGGEPLAAETLVANSEWSIRWFVETDDSSGYLETAAVSAAADGDAIVLSFPDDLPTELTTGTEILAEVSVALGAALFEGPAADLSFSIVREQTTFSAVGFDAAVTAIGTVVNASPTLIPVGNSPFAPGNLELAVEALSSVEVDATSTTIDLDGDPLAISRVVSDPTDGRVEIVDGTTLRYVSLSEAPGLDAFVVALTDGFTEVDVIALVDVLPSNAPIARDATVIVTAGEARSFVLDGADRDDPPVFVVEEGAERGTVTLTDAASGAVTYTPDDDFVGTDEFTWSVSGGGETSRVATVTLQVRRTAPGDRDGDGTPDAVDNCPDDFNADQANLDGDGAGDACDDDDDGDGIVDVLDPCPFVAGDDADLDEDGRGDLCDDDDDGDDVPDVDDVCPRDEDPEQLDTDGDERGDVCDDDDDDDLVPDDDDNCPLVANRAQWDDDEDGAGDVCDDDDDNDDVPDIDDVCPFTPDPDQTDTDDDGVGDACDGDQDGDGALTDDDCDDLDPSVRYLETWYADLDEDGFGDPDVTIEECAALPPAFYVADSSDNCPEVSNPDQLDTDDDGVGDACEEGGDAGPDAGDVGPDVGGDVGLDVGGDVGGDVGPDGGADVGLDVGGDVGPDARGDVGPDAGDASSDGGPDAVGDADPDAPGDTAGDTGEGTDTVDGDADVGGADGAADGAADAAVDADGSGADTTGGGDVGCACSTGSGSAPTAWFLLTGVALAVRRKR